MLSDHAAVLCSMNAGPNHQSHVAATAADGHQSDEEETGRGDRTQMEEIEKTYHRVMLKEKSGLKEKEKKKKKKKC